MEVSDAEERCDVLLDRMSYYTDALQLKELEPDRVVYNAVLNALAKSKQVRSCMSPPPPRMHRTQSCLARWRCSHPAPMELWAHRAAGADYGYGEEQVEAATTMVAVMTEPPRSTLRG